MIVGYKYNINERLAPAELVQQYPVGMYTDVDYFDSIGLSLTVSILLKKSA